MTALDRGLIAPLALVLAVLAAPARADSARDHVARATEAHKAGDFATALAELQIAYKLEPRPELLFALGQVSVKLDRCDQAVSYYEQYLATSPTAQARADTTEAISLCKTKLATSAMPPPPAPPPAHPRATARRPWYADKIGDALVAGGIVSAVVGLVVYRSARGDLDDAEHAPDLAHYEDLRDSASSKRVWSVVLVGAGVALIAGGAVHYAIAPVEGGGVVTVAGRF